MKRIYLFIVIVLLVMPKTIYAEKVKVTLNACVDGDTAWLNYEGEKTKFRFLAIDTPESVHPIKEVQYYGKDASEYTCNLLTNAKKLYVEFDEKGSKEDKYGRNLAWIWIDDELLQNVLVRNGYATVAYVYSKYSYVNDLCSSQASAIVEKKGIWQDETREVGYCSTIDYSNGSATDALTYTVTFKYNDETKKVSVIKGHTVKEIKTPKKDGFIFKGWYNKDKLFDFNTEITKNITLEAKYDIDYKYLAYAFVVLILSLILKSSNKKRKKKNGKNN